MNKRLSLLLIVTLLLVVSVTAPTSAQSTSRDLTETWEVKTIGVEFDMPYPAGWITANQGRTRRLLNELEADQTLAKEGAFATQGYSVEFAWLRSADLGLAPEATVEQLLAAVGVSRGYQDVTSAMAMEFLGKPALQVRTIDGMGNHVVAIVSIAGPQKADCLLELAAPSATALEAFLPTWEAMLGGITVDGGIIVNLGDYGLYLNCQGSGSPTVIFEHRLGSDAQNSWENILPTVSSATRACQYNRLGASPSDSVPEGEVRSTQDQVDDLIRLLEVAQIEPPYVLVGHSIAGLNILLFVDQHPELVEGIVLIDVVHPDQFERWQMDPAGPEISGERLDLATSFEQAAGINDFGDRPLVVLTAWMGDHDATWIDMQEEYATYSTNSRHIIAEHSRYDIMVSEPELIIDAILWVLEEVRAPENDAAETSSEIEALALNGVEKNADWEPYPETFDGVEMVLVPAGCFSMGSDDIGPPHEVCFDEAFWIDRTEVTNGQFAAFNGQAEQSSSTSGDNQPREQITWNEAQAFCENRGARLPTEAEWEYAVRGPDDLAYPWGDLFVPENVVYRADLLPSHGATEDVGSRLEGVSWVGAYDLIGNVWEWVFDKYGVYPSERQVNPQGPEEGDRRVLRGGSWYVSYPDFLLATYRDFMFPQYWSLDLGFRCARSQ